MPAPGNCVCVLATNYEEMHNSSMSSFGLFRIFTRKMPRHTWKLVLSCSVWGRRTISFTLSSCAQTLKEQVPGRRRDSILGLIQNYARIDMQRIFPNVALIMLTVAATRVQC